MASLSYQRFIAWRWSYILSASWQCNGLPRRRRIAGLKGRPATRALRHGPYSYGRQQWGILDNGRKPDPATMRGGRRFSDCKLLLMGKKKRTVPIELATANYVPAAAVRRRWQALLGITRRKARVGGMLSLLCNLWAQPRNCNGNWRS